MHPAFNTRMQLDQKHVTGIVCYLSDPSWVQQDALPLLHELEEVAAAHLHRPKGGQQGPKYIAPGIWPVLPIL